MNEGPVSMGVAFRHDLLRVSLVSRLLYCLFSKNKRLYFFLYILREIFFSYFLFYFYMENIELYYFFMIPMYIKNIFILLFYSKRRALKVGFYY